MNKNYSRK